ncbi:alpha/beta hydrolase [Amycolatopsis acidiphila]|uniref:Alpha/beta hydrolase n=1 Tax=Amycolatopsis acidiphila TaxID=715473 RepID=A0A557ZTT4_9PSEU|nr:alpha/beta hydrolase [Amycolatopsis acidiphila]TVT15415.1 alpha/beta hydrolase [Amycolatopsis acidiphila]UIJ59516.1 alpha/beta hydrolase [Amycolatopsis acidiphila]GHG80365.1 alpha/beta hydrolase [Amycolatopsis acidiphila]
MANPLLPRVEAAAARLIYALPRPIRRLIAGKPIRLDGQELALDAQLLLRLQQVGKSSMSQDTPELARAMLAESQHLVSGKPIEPVSTRELTIPDDNDGIPATLYTPDGLPEDSGLLVFYHGGGWVIGTRASHDNTARFLARYAGVRVLSIEYRLAPEHPFPAAADDAVAAFDYAYAKAKDLGADPERIAVGGDSAGGNLAAVAAQVTTRRGGPAPAFQLLLYPGVDASVRRRSRELFGSGFFLTDTDMTWFIDHYAPTGVDRTDPRLSPLLAKDFSGLPPAYIATAGFDPLRDEGEAYGEKLREAGVPVAASRQSDLIHGYVNFLGVGTRFREAAAEAAGALRLGLAGIN